MSVSLVVRSMKPSTLHAVPRLGDRNDICQIVVVPRVRGRCGSGHGATRRNIDCRDGRRLWTDVLARWKRDTHLPEYVKVIRTH